MQGVVVVVQINQRDLVVDTNGNFLNNFILHQ
jgi:hypothetical protein